MLKEVILDFDGAPEVLPGDALYDYSGPKKLSGVKSVEAKVDTRDASLWIIGDLFPNLEKLRLNNSIIPSIRDIGCRLDSLRFLSVANSGISSLSGVGAISQNLEELHLAFNAISDVSDLMGMNKLQILDLEGNRLSDLSNLRYLTCCTELTSLTLAGNPGVFEGDAYERAVAGYVPNLMYLDEKRIREPLFAVCPPSGHRTPRVSAPAQELLHPVCPPQDRPVHPPGQEGSAPVRPLSHQQQPAPRRRAGEKSEPVFTEWINDQISERTRTSRTDRLFREPTRASAFWDRQASIVRPSAGKVRCSLKVT
jgi:Leucine-rich repeat (LRR) protein